MRNNVLKTNIAGLQLPNPTMLASGILGYSAETWAEVEKAGAGAIVTKSVGVKPRDGYPNPTVVQTECGLVNAMGLPNPGIEEFGHEIRGAGKALHVPLIVSVYGFSANEYADASVRAIKAGADAVELNISCPHVQKTGCEIGQDPALVREVVRKVKSHVQKPVLVKLSPNVRDIVEIAHAADTAGADALTLINTVKAMAIDVETGLPTLGNKLGGLSGSAIKPIALRCVYEVYEEIKKPLVGCGGIADWRDAVEFVLAGASAVQIGTAISIRNIEVFREIASGMEAYVKRKRYGSVTEVVGKSHKN